MGLYMRRELRLGPGLLVTAAFIGPGTVTTASVAGAQFGFALLWAVVFSVIATLILQEMAARLGVIGRCGLGEALRVAIQHPILRPGLTLLIIVGIGCGNAAFEMGNILGADILNVCWIAGASATVNPLIVGQKVIHFSFPAMLFIVFTMLVLMRTGNRLTRVEGLFLCLFYCAYLVLAGKLFL